MPFHVYLYDGKPEHYFGVYAFDLTETQLEQRILQPYRQGRPIVTSGKTIDSIGLKTIRISETEEPSAELRPLAEETRRRERSSSSVEYLITTLGRDRTDDFITAPAGSGTAATLPSAAPTAALDRVLAICERVPHVVRQLATRDRRRPPLTIDDEHDLQYLVRALLALEFDDVRREEWTPSYAGSSKRQDFLIKAEGVVVELKRTRDGLSDRALGSELIEDIAHYGGHPDCRQLVCFVFDPEHRLTNPKGLASDLEKSPPRGLDVRVVIVPR